MIERYDNSLLEKIYEQVLLLETPATEGNIEKYIKRYFQDEIKEYIDDESKRIYRVANLLKTYYKEYNLASTGISYQEFEKKTPRSVEHLKKIFKADAIKSIAEVQDYRSEIMRELESWTPKVQQVLKNLNMNVDIFGYGSREEVLAALQTATSHTTKTASKKAYKRAGDVNVMYEDDKVMIVKPRTWEESRKYFGYKRESILDGTKKIGARWCTSAAAPDGPKMFNKYVRDYSQGLYYIVSKVAIERGILLSVDAPVDTLWAIRKEELQMGKARIKKLEKLFYDFMKTYIAHQLKKGENIQAAVDDAVTHVYSGLFVQELKEEGKSHPAEKYYSQLFHHLFMDIIEVRDQSNSRDLGEYYLANLAYGLYITPSDSPTEQDIDKMINFLSCILFDAAPAQAATPTPTE